LPVIPAKAEELFNSEAGQSILIQKLKVKMDPGFRRDDGVFGPSPGE
jgi:hypothetical protein